MKLDGIRQKVFIDRYSLKDKDGTPTEKMPNEMWRRVAHGIAQQEKPKNRKKWETEFYNVMADFKFVPGGRILSGAGTGYEVTYYNCFVIPSPKDSREGILESLKQLVEIQSRSGGVGLNLSSLRPRGARVKKVNGTSSGPVTWAGLFSYATHDVVQQGGCFSEDTKIMTHLGLVPIKEIVEQKRNWYVATHIGYQKVTTKFNNGVKALYEVKTKAGLSVKVTPEHRFVTVDSTGHFYLKKLGEFGVGDPIVLFLGEWPSDIPYVPLNTRTPSPSKYSYGRVSRDLPKVLDEKLAFLVGVYDADGSKIRDEFSPNGKGLRIAVAKNRPKDLETLKQTIRDVFFVEPTVKDGDGAVYNVSIYSRQVNEFLKLNGFLKDYSISVQVPQPIFSSPKKVVEAYIAGVFFGDGTNRGGKGGLRITTVSHTFAQQLQVLLLNLGIASKIQVQKRDKQGWRTLYTVTVNGARFMKWFQEFLAIYNEKVEDLEISKRDATFNWSFNLTEKFLYLSGFQRTIARTNPHTSQKSVLFLQQSIEQIQEQDRNDIEILSSTVPDTITAITPIGRETVYDLEVDRAHLLSGNGFYTSNSRRGATMLMLWDWHPDVEEFITVKQDLSKINGANLSVCISDAFMEAVKKDKDWELVYPDLDDPRYDAHWNGEIDEWRKLGGKVKVHKTVKARYLWDLICTAAWRSAEPGLHFLERSNKRSNTWSFEKLIATNPCLPGDAWVHTQEGPRQISDLIGRQFVARVNGEDLISGKEGFFKTATKQLVYIETKEGYKLRLTEDHKMQKVIRLTRNTLETSWQEAGKFQPGDQIVLHDHRGNTTWEGKYSYDDGYLMGLLIGDGTLKSDKAVLSVWSSIATRENGSQAIMAQALQSASGMQHRSDFVGWQSISERKESRLSLASIKKLALELGMEPGKKLITNVMEKASSEFYRGLLRGFFDADGSVQGTQKKGVSVRLTQSDLSMLETVQRMLLRLGIASCIYKERRLAGFSLLPNGKGEKKAYATKPQHELVISNENLVYFAERVGFADTEKSARLDHLLAAYKRTLNRERFIARVVSVNADTIEDVYDVQIPGVHAFDANGFYVHNCGEQPLGAWAVCNLGAMNLAAYVKNEKFDFDNFGKDVRTAIRFLDNVIDDTYYFFDKNEKCAKDIRRTGLGIMGIADALIKMKLRYGLEESLPVVRKIFATLRDNAYDVSADLAKEKGAFPKFNKKKYLQGYHIQNLPKAIRAKIGKYGIRNAVLLTIAPTGTTSLLAGVSSGIEPVYEFTFIRRDRTGEHILHHPLLEEWKKENPTAASGQVPERPDYFVSANDLTPLEHATVQAIAQEYIDSSISKTVNAPNTHTVEDVKVLYMAAYDMGLKGVTYMRDGSRAGVFTRVEEKKKEEPKAKPQPSVFGEPVIPRPTMVEGVTYQTETPVGTAFITINHDEHKNPFELFITIGKSGSDVAAMAEALGKMISLNLRLSAAIAPREKVREIIARLAGIGGARSIGFGKEKVRSLPDAVAKVLAHQYGFTVNGRVEDKAGFVMGNGQGNGSAKPNGQANGVSEPQSKKEGAVVLQQLALDGSASAVSASKEAMHTIASTHLFDICPECGTGSFAYEEGCKKCYSCGYSEC